jgi:hypothetical protein
VWIFKHIAQNQFQRKGCKTMAQSKHAAVTTTAQYDLTLTLSKFLDLHLMFPLLEFVEGNALLNYKPEDIQRARLTLAQPSNMMEYAIEIFQELNKTEQVPADMIAKHNAVIKQIEVYEKSDTTLRSFFADLVCVAQHLYTTQNRGSPPSLFTVSLVFQN